jgi:hypothetical protein
VIEKAVCINYLRVKRGQSYVTGARVNFPEILVGFASAATPYKQTGSASRLLALCTTRQLL